MLNYSKWDKIEVSDDEDDTHPNIDTPSLFKWRHEARVQRMQEFENQKREAEDEMKEIQEQKSFVQKQIDDKAGPIGELEKLLVDIELKEKKNKEKREELIKKEKQQPWNVDTISKESWSKTLINKTVPASKKELTDEERSEQYSKFIEEHEQDVKMFGMLSKWEDCKRFLLDKPDVCCEDASNYLTIWCLNLEIESKNDLMTHISKQVISLQYILELAKQLDCDPRSCISTFFTKIQKADKEYMDAFNNELESFRKRIKERAQVKIAEAVKEVEEEERQKRLGPGGLDPLEVIETLPPDLRECFDQRDTEKLKKVIETMDKEQANYHIKRCIDSGLWVLPEGESADDEPTYDAAENVASESSKETQEAS